MADTSETCCCTTDTEFLSLIAGQVATLGEDVEVMRENSIAFHEAFVDFLMLLCMFAGFACFLTFVKGLELPWRFKK